MPVGFVGKRDGVLASQTNPLGTCSTDTVFSSHTGSEISSAACTTGLKREASEKQESERVHGVTSSFSIFHEGLAYVK